MIPNPEDNPQDMRYKQPITIIQPAEMMKENLGVCDICERPLIRGNRLHLTDSREVCKSCLNTPTGKGEQEQKRHCIRCASVLSSDRQFLCSACRAAEEVRKANPKTIEEAGFKQVPGPTPIACYKKVRVNKAMSAGELVTHDDLKQHQQIYLAFPYSHPDAEVRQNRFSDCLLMADMLMTRTGFPVFAPIVYGHPFVELKRPGDFETWRSLNLTMLAQWASVLIVGTAEGWMESRGVAAEIEAAIDHGKPTFLVDPHLSNFPDWSFR